jgi:hypothetical protein
MSGNFFPNESPISPVTIKPYAELYLSHLISSPGLSAPRLSSIVNAVKHRHHAAISLGNRTCSW